MPGSSWVSWGKKKPPAASIAGTREPMQPPSISVPPYPPEESSPSPASSTAMASYPGPSAAGDKPMGYGSTVPDARGTDAAVQTAGTTGGYATGPYGTGGTNGPAPTQTQQGFYRTSTPDNGGPVALAADARGGHAPAMPPGYSGAAPNAGYPAPNAYGAVPAAPESPPPVANYAPVTTPATNYGPADYGTADAGYPAPAANATYPAAAYPTTAAGNDYPATGADPGAPVGGTGGYPAAATAPPAYGGTPYPVGPSSYPDTPSTYGAPAPYGSYGTGPAAGPAYSTSSGYGTPTGAASGTPGTSAGYRPGSTSRNSSLLGPTGGTTTTTPARTYPNTYTR